MILSIFLLTCGAGLSDLPPNNSVSVGNSTVTGRHPGTYSLNQEMKVNINSDMGPMNPDGMG